VGISTGIIHYYFRTKEELLQESFRYMTDRARARSRRALEGVADPTERLFAVVAANLPTANDPGDWPIWIHLWAESLRDPNIRKLNSTSYSSWIALVQGLIEEGQAEGAFLGVDAKVFATQLLAMIDGLVIQAVVSGRSASARTVHDLVMEFLVQSVPRPAMRRVTTRS
jgi:AcrR family transcriptional regulator